MPLLSSADFLFKINLFQGNFRNTIRVSNSFDPGQVRRSVGYQQMIKVAASKVRSISFTVNCEYFHSQLIRAFAFTNDPEYSFTFNSLCFHSHLTLECFHSQLTLCVFIHS